MELFFILLIGKIINLLINLINLGSGSTWPGNLALIINKQFIKKIVEKNKHLKIVVVAGTNGKTTTTSLIKYLIDKLGYKVFSNTEGANLLNGIASSLIKNSNLLGRLDHNYAVFETDEFSFPLLLKQVDPRVIIILNLFRDQLDRYGEVNTIGQKWFSSMKELPKETMVFFNGDDPFLYFKSKSLRTKNIYFGIKENLMTVKNIPHDVDFNYCPNCLTKLEYEAISYAHLGNFKCKKCGLNKEKFKDFGIKINYPLEGYYNIYNTNAVLMFLKYYLNYDLKEINSLLKGFKAPFGRQEEIIYKGKKIYLLLSKNPAGFNQSLKSISKMLNKNKGNLLILLNDRIPDGKDISWIWDVDFNVIYNKANSIFISGDRTYDMAIRFKYEYQNVVAIENLKSALEKAISSTNTKETLYILPTYSAMLETRKILVGKKLI